MRLTDRERDFIRHCEPLIIDDSDPKMVSLSPVINSLLSWGTIVDARTAAGYSLFPDFGPESRGSAKGSMTDWKASWPSLDFDKFNVLTQRASHLVWLAARWQRRFRYPHPAP